MFFKKIVIITTVIAALALGGLLYVYFSARPTGPAGGEAQPVAPAESARVKAAAAEQAVKIQQAERDWNDALQATYAVDKDFDGLTDEEEKKYGTKPEAADTDADGLLDKSEIEIYQTDPLKKDTDKDGHSDGAEVRAGYNPKGAGKLPDVIPTSDVIPAKAGI